MVEKSLLYQVLFEIKLAILSGKITIKNQFSLSTMWIRSGVEKANDKFIKALSMEDRAELQLAIQEHNSLGE